MNRRAWISFALVVAATMASSAEAKQQETEEERAARAREAEASAQLDKTTWSAEWAPLSGGKPKKPLKDTLTFEGRKVTSSALAKEGYPPANFTLTVPDEKTVVWETMQMKEGTGVVFWRGERTGDTMRGIVSKQPENGDAQTSYSFIATLTGGTPSAPAAAGAPAPAAQSAVPAAAPAKAAPAPAPKKEEKKRKGWFF